MDIQKQKMVYHALIAKKDVDNLVYFKEKSLRTVALNVQAHFKKFGSIPSMEQLKMLPKIKEQELTSYVNTLYDYKLDQLDPKFVDQQVEDFLKLAYVDQKVSALINELKLAESNPTECFNKLLSFTQEVKESSSKIKSNTSLFSVKSADEWIKQSELTPVPRKLFAGLWFENEVCVLFSATNMGKSALAVQILDALSRGQDVLPGFVNETEAHKVLYLDFELSAKQFHLRTFDFDVESVSNIQHKFHENFLRAEMNPVGDFKKAGYASYEAYFNGELSKMIESTGCKTLCIDNLSWLLDEGEKSQRAIQIMKFILELRVKYGLSILVIAHTPKVDKNKIIEINDLAGSAALGNFVRSAFTIGRAIGDESLRYIKQLKVTNENITHGSDNVAVCRMNKHSGLLKFEYIECSDEYNLKNAENREQQLGDRDTRIMELNSRGIGPYTIAKQIGCSASTVKRVIEKSKGPVKKVLDVNNHSYDLLK